MLHVDALRAGYGGGTVLHAITLTVPAGAVHAVVGHNGAGKTTLLHTIAGLLRPTAGRIRLGNSYVTGRPAHRIARGGVALVPQGRRVFASLTVAEHLTLTRRKHPDGGWSPARILAEFPQLGQRRSHRGGQLSGGEQQMLAIARALLTQPRLVLFAGPTEGLSPLLVGRVGQVITELAADGVAVLLATPDTRLALAVADHVTVLAAGRIAARCDGAGLRADPAPLLAVLAPTPAAAGGRPAEPAPVRVPACTRLPSAASTGALAPFPPDREGPDQ